MSDPIHLCYCANKKMLRPLCVSAYSAARSLDGEELVVTVFHENLTADDEAFLRGILAPFASTCTVEMCPVDLSMFATFTGLHGEVIPFVKILIPRLVGGRSDRIIYLDADTLVTDGLAELYRCDLEGAVLGAVAYESLELTLESDFFAAQGFDLSSQGFNSGVMVIDTNTWTRSGLSESIYTYAKKMNRTYGVHDQPILNAVFYESYAPLPERYNKRASPDRPLDEQDTTDGVLHFVGVPKPWDLFGKWLNQNTHLYHEYRKAAGIRQYSVTDILYRQSVGTTIKRIASGLKKIHQASVGSVQ